MTNEKPEAGWYDDPDVPGLERHWDGTRWTDVTRSRKRSIRRDGLIAGLFGGGHGGRATDAKPAPMSAAERVAAASRVQSEAGPTARQRREQERAEAQARIACQFCHEKGGVTVKQLQKKQGVSGGKATSALLTGGVSLVAVGLSKKGWVSQLRCSKCKMTWEVG